MPAFMPTFIQLLRYIFIMLAGVVWQSTAAEYDAGVSNVTQNGQRSFVFNQLGQLASSGEISFRYDGYNRRIKKSGRSTSYSIDNQSGPLLLTDGSQGITRYIYLGSQLIARIGNAAAIKDKPSYTGHLEDADLSLTYMQQRYYDPLLGRFYSNDPVGFRASNPMMFNRYRRFSS